MATRRMPLQITFSESEDGRTAVRIWCAEVNNETTFGSQLDALAHSTEAVERWMRGRYALSYHEETA